MMQYLFLYNNCATQIPERNTARLESPPNVPDVVMSVDFHVSMRACVYVLCVCELIFLFTKSTKTGKI